MAEQGMDKGTEEKIQQLQLLEQNMQNFLLQKQQQQSQLMEIESALKELENKKDGYKIIGSIMVHHKKEDLVDDLNKKKEIIELRIKTLEKQEDKIKEKAKSLQTEVLSLLSGNKEKP